MNPLLRAIAELIGQDQAEAGWLDRFKSNPNPSPSPSPTLKPKIKATPAKVSPTPKPSPTPIPVPSADSGLGKFLSPSQEPQKPIDLEQRKQEIKAFLNSFGGGTSAIPVQDDIDQMLRYAASVETPELAALRKQAELSPELTGKLAGYHQPRLSYLTTAADQLFGTKMTPAFQVNEQQAEREFNPLDFIKEKLTARKEAAAQERAILKEIMDARFGTRPTASGYLSQGMQQQMPRQLGLTAPKLLDNLEKMSQQYKRDPVVQSAVKTLNSLGDAAIGVIMAKDNKLAANGLRTMIAKGVFNEVGAMSEGDVRRAGLSAGWKDRLQQWWNMATSGTIPDEVPLEDAKNLVRVLMAKKISNAHDVRDTYLRKGALVATTAGLGPGEVDSALQDYFPNYGDILGKTTVTTPKNKKVKDLDSAIDTKLKQMGF